MTWGRLLLAVTVTMTVTYGVYGEEDGIYKFSAAKDELKKRTQQMENAPKLSKDEQLVDSYLRFIWTREYDRLEGSGLSFSRPLQQTFANLSSSDVYRILRRMPKGANLHAHENHILSKSAILDAISECGMMSHLYVNEDSLKLDFFHSNPGGKWNLVTNSGRYSREFVEKNAQLIEILDDKAERYPCDSDHRWSLINKLWSRIGGAISSHERVKPLILRRIYQSMIDENVQFIETRQSLVGSSSIYRMNKTAPGEKIRIDLSGHEGETEIKLTLDIIKDFQRQYPDRFIGHRRIMTGKRYGESEDNQRRLQKAARFQTMFPKHIVGYDLVSEEDAGFSNLYFIDTLLKAKKEEVDLYLHSGETNHPNYRPTLTDDISPKQDNVYDAIALGARRIGHGLALAKHPALWEVVKSRGIALELCPASNELLGYTPDIRNHPAVQFIAAGLPIVLGSDDPGTFGYVNLTTDWYLAFVGWGLGLGQLKKLARDSLRYSSLEGSDLKQALRLWGALWEKFIVEVKEEACGIPRNADSITFQRVLPRDGAVNGETTVHLYGRHLETIICSDAYCLFGDQKVPAVYKSPSHVICTVSGTRNPETVELSLCVDGNCRSTGGNFSFAHQLYVPPTSGGPKLTSLSALPMGTAGFLCLLVAFGV